jgi:hypothetical protein
MIDSFLSDIFGDKAGTVLYIILISLAVAAIVWTAADIKDASEYHNKVVKAVQEVERV